MFLLAGLWMSQFIADAVKAGLPPGELSSWCWAVAAQYVACLVLLVWFDHTAFRDAATPAMTAVWLIRTIHLMKRL